MLYCSRFRPPCVNLVIQATLCHMLTVKNVHLPLIETKQHLPPTYPTGELRHTSHNTFCDWTLLTAAGARTQPRTLSAHKPGAMAGYMRFCIPVRL